MYITQQLQTGYMLYIRCTGDQFQYTEGLMPFVDAVPLLKGILNLSYK